MANDELEAMVRDELFWDPRVDSDAVAVSANEARSPYEHGEGQAPGAGVKASPGSASPDQRQSAAMWLLPPPIPDYGVRVGLPDRRAGRSWNLFIYMTIIVSDGKTPVAVELSK